MRYNERKKDTRMKFKLLTLVILAALFTVSVAAQDPEVAEYNENGVSFTYEPSLASDIEVINQEDVPMEEGMPYWAATPAYLQLNFVDYPELESFFMAPTLNVYNTADFAAFTIDGQETLTLQGQLDALNSLLSDQSDLSAFSEVATTSGGSDLPFVPLFNAAQVLRIQPQYLEFQNGRGIRYLTYYSQSVDPITDYQLFYTFQGVTNDGSKYVSAIFPVTSGQLPDEIDYGSFDYDAFAEVYETYLSEILTTLNGLPEDRFNPSLAALDALVASINVE
jgi:hypothetical protein